MNAWHWMWLTVRVIVALNLVVIIFAVLGRVLELLAKLARTLDHHVGQAVIAHARASAILLRNEFECFGGPRDGETIVWKQPELYKYVPGGAYYHCHDDNRMHFEQLAAITHGDDSEC